MSTFAIAGVIALIVLAVVIGLNHFFGPDAAPAGGGVEDIPDDSDADLRAFFDSIDGEKREVEVATDAGAVTEDYAAADVPQVPEGADLGSESPATEGVVIAEEATTDGGGEDLVLLTVDETYSVKSLREILADNNLRASAPGWWKMKKAELVAAINGAAVPA